EHVSFAESQHVSLLHADRVAESRFLRFGTPGPELHNDMRHCLLPRSGDGRHCTVWPPSITRACPTTKAAVSEHSQTTAAAISSGLPIRPTGSSAITFARPSAVPPVKRPIIGVSM